MINLKKSFVFALLLLFLSFQFVISQQVVQVTQPETKEKTSILGFLKSPIFWWVLGGFILLILFLVAVFFVVKWLVQFIKNRSDIFWRLKSERIKLAKIQKRFPSKAWLKIEKNTPIRLVKKEGGRLSISNPIAYHRGDYVTHEGNFIIAMNLKNNKKFFFFPITDLLVIPNKRKIEISQKDKFGKAQKLMIDNLPQASEIIQFNDNEILIFAESLSNVGMFFVPVVKAIDGKIIDLALPTFQSLKDVAIDDYLYQQTDEFVKVAKKSIDLNPHLRMDIKRGDANQSVEIPNTER